MLSSRFYKQICCVVVFGLGSSAWAATAADKARPVQARQSSAEGRPSEPWRKYCPEGISKQPVELSGIELVREENIPLTYSGGNILEGPVWHDGALYYSNIGSRKSKRGGAMLTNQSTIWRWEPGSAAVVWLDDARAGTNGLALDAAGDLLVGRQLDGSISRIDWQTKAVTTVADQYEDKRFNSPNDLAVAADGSIYFSDPNWNIPAGIDPKQAQGGGAPGTTAPGQRVYRVAADGTVRPLAVTELVPELRDKPNGVLLSLDERQLYVGGMRGLWVFDLAHGQVSQPRQLLKSSIDGMTKDCAGNVYVTTSRPAPDQKNRQVVLVLDARHRELGALEVPGIQHVTNAAFGGEDGKTLFVTSLTFPNGDDGKPNMCGKRACLPASIYSAEMPVRGFPD